MPLIGEDHYKQIRAAIDISLDEDSLPGDTIGLDLFMGAGTRWVQSRTQATDDNAKLAAIYAVAALIVKKIPQVVSEKLVGGDSYTRKEVDLNALQADLWASAQGYVNLANEQPTPTQNIPTLFTLASGQRGR